MAGSAATETIVPVRAHDWGARRARPLLVQDFLRAHLNRFEVIGSALCVVAWSAWLGLIARHWEPSIWVAQIGLLSAFLFWGRLFVLATGLDRLLPRSLLLPLSMGAIVFPFLLAAIRLLTPVSLIAWYAVFWGLGGAINLAFTRRLSAWRATPRMATRELAALAIILVAVTCWLQHLMPLVSAEGDQLRYHPFIEFFFHTTHSTPLLIEGTPVRAGSFQFAGAGLGYYHYASYAVPALVSAIGRCPVYDALVGSWYPLGMFMAGSAAWVLGSVLFRWSIAIWSVVVICVLPDPYFWGTPIAFYSWQGMAEGSPALTWAANAAAMSVVLMTLAIRQARVDWAVVAFALAGSTVFFKANIVVAALPLCGLYFLCGWKRFGNRVMIPACVLLALAGALSLWAGTHLRSAPTIGFDRQCGQQFAEHLYEYQIPKNSYIADWKPWVFSDSPGIAVPARLGLILALTFQAMILPIALILLLSLAVQRRQRLNQVLVVLVLVIYLASAVFLPPNRNGDPFELQHRSFMWVYFVTMIVTVGAAAGLWQGWLGRKLPTCSSAVVLLLLPFFFGRQMMINPDATVPAGLRDAAHFIRTHGPTTDIVLASDNDPHLILAALSQRRSYVCISPTDPFPGSGVLASLHQRRAEVARQLLRAGSRDEIRALAAEMGVRWYVLLPNEKPAWPADVLNHPVYQSGSVRAYDFLSLDGLAGEKKPPDVSAAPAAGK